MIVNIGELYRVDHSDGLNWTLQEKRIGKKGKSKGKEVWKTLGYHASLRLALQSCYWSYIQREKVEVDLAETILFLTHQEEMFRSLAIEVLST